MSRKAKKLLGRVAFYLFLALIVFYTVFPFYWAIVSSLKAGSELFKVEFWPANPAWMREFLRVLGTPVGV